MPTARVSSRPANKPTTSAKASWRSTSSLPTATASRPRPALRSSSRNRLHCAECDIEYREPTPALFSFNHPVGACPACRGFGRIISIDYDLALPDRSRTLAQGVVRPWQTGLGAECQDDLLRTCRQFGVPTDVPFNQLPKKWQDLVIEGEPGYGKDEAHEWPRAWYGVKGYFRWLESKAYKMHVRVLLSRYRAYTPCPDCRGKRFQPEALLYRCDGGKSEGRRPKAEGRPKSEGRSPKRGCVGCGRREWLAHAGRFLPASDPRRPAFHRSARRSGTGCDRTIRSAWS